MEYGRAAAGAVKIVGGPSVPHHLVRLRGSGPSTRTGKVDQFTEVIRSSKTSETSVEEKVFSARISGLNYISAVLE